MSNLDERLEALRAARDAARADLLKRVEAAKGLAKPAELARRAKADAQLHAREALAQAMEIAADNRGVLAGTLTALLLWATRRKLLQGAAGLVGRLWPRRGAKPDGEG